MKFYRSNYKDEWGNRKQAQAWRADFTDHLGRRQRIPLGTTNRRAAEGIGRKIEKLVSCRLSREPMTTELINWLESIPQALKARLVKVNLLEAEQAAGGELLTDHLGNWKRSILDSGNTKQQAVQQYNRALRIVEGCKFLFWSDVSAVRIQQYLAGLRNGDGISSRTANAYLQAMKQFSRWMVRNRFANTNPLEHLQQIKIDKAEAINRRALTPAELGRLLAVTNAAGRLFGIEGRERALLYRLAAETGLRVSEIHSLTVSSFDLGQMTITVSAGYTKNRREAILPLKLDTTEFFREHLRGKLPQAQAFNLPHKGNMARMLKKDLTKAGIDPANNGSGKLDFHALRHTFGTLLAAGGTHPKTAQKLMRHSDINLTMGRYTHVLHGQEQAAIDALPDFTDPAQESQRRTGTDDAENPKTGTDFHLAKSLAKLCAKQRILTDFDEYLAPKITNSADPPKSSKNHCKCRTYR